VKQLVVNEMPPFEGRGNESRVANKWKLEAEFHEKNEKQRQNGDVSGALGTDGKTNPASECFPNPL
jgi:hypothetical protein